MGQLTAEEKEFLSDEEIAAIEDDDDADLDADDLDDDDADDADETPPPTDDEPAPADDDKPVDDKAKDDDKAADADDDTPADDDAPPADDTPAPDPNAMPMAGMMMEMISQEEIDKLQASVDEAKQKFDDGEIPYDEVLTAQRALDSAAIKNDMAESFNRKLTQGLWEQAQNRFWINNPIWSQNSMLKGLLATTVNNMLDNPEDSKLGNDDLLAEAQRRVQKEMAAAGFQVVSGNKKTDDADTKDSGKAALAAAKKAAGNRKSAPANLGDVPAADLPEGTDEFAYLDNLEGEKYQAAIDKLTPEQLERYEDRM